MKSKKIVIICLLFVILLGILFFILKPKENYSGKYIRLTVNAATLRIKLLDNPSANEFYEKIKDENLKIRVSDSNNYAKIGNLEYHLSSDDKNISIKPGDVVLIQGNEIAIFYNKNTGNYTKIGRIENTNESYLKTILGNDEVTLDFSV